MPRKITDEEFPNHFWSRVNILGEDDCWEWMGSRSSKGYGSICYKNRVDVASRVAYRLTRGDIPDGLFVLHSCDNPPCCNPKHLRVGTREDNTADMIERNLQSRCPGEKNGQSKLNENQVREIRRRKREDGVTNVQLAKEYGVNHTLIGFIVRNVSWRHVE